MNTDAQRTITLPLRDKTSDKEIILKTKKKTPSKKTTKTNTLIDKMNEIGQLVNTHLGKYKNDYEIITSLEGLNKYIDSANKNKTVAIDTETTGLSPIMDKIVGMSLYTPGEKGVYIPINHVDYITEKRLPNQLYELEVQSALSKLTADIVMFNAVFDIRVIRNQVGNYLKCFWDCYLAGKLMNENEPNGGLKALHEKYVLHGEDKEFSFGQLFEKISFDKIPIEFAYIYAAHDAVITYELYEFQKRYLNPEGKNGMNKVYEVFKNIEMPCVDVVADMEDTGFVLDMEYQKKLHDKYHKLLDEEETKLISELKKSEDKFKKWQESPEANILIQKKDKDGKLKFDKKGNPEYEKTSREKLPENIEDINLGSPSQLSILLYDIMGLKHSSKKDKATSTSEAALKSINSDFTNMLLDYRSFRKLIDAFIDSLPEHLEKDGRIHCSLNAYGAKCIVGNTVILSEEGYSSLKSIFKEEDIWEEEIPFKMPLINRNLKAETTQYKIKYKNKDTIKLCMRGGFEIEGTPNHPIIISDINKDDLKRNRSSKQKSRLEKTQHFEKLENIKVGDIVAIPFGYNIFPTDYVKLDIKVKENKTHKNTQTKLPSYCSEEFAELLGMYHADGTIKDSNGSFKIAIHNKDREVRNRVKYLAKKLFNLNAREYVDSRNGEVSTVFGSKAIEEIGKYLGKGARNKQIPSIVMKSPKSVIASYIRGLTLDSSFNPERQRLFISCYDEMTVNFILCYLMNIGIIPTTRHSKYSKGFDHMGKYGDEKLVRRIGVSGEMYKKFIDEIGTIQSNKTMYFDSYHSNYHLIYNNCFYAYVDKIEASVNDVYDVHMPETHSFIANGIINHNTGRFSCSEPNLQQIPSKNKEIRKLFIAPTNYRDTESRNSFLTFKNTEEILIDENNKWTFVKDLKVGDTIFNTSIVSIKNSENNIEIGVENVLSIETRERYVLIGADYSQQEPKLLATMCQDENMMRDASEGKDLYSAVASRAFHTTYEECLEHFPEGTPIVKDEKGNWRYATDIEMCNEKFDKFADGENDTYSEGKARRTQAKVILLGMMYGRGPKALAEQLKCSTDEAKDIMNSVFSAFPRIKKFDDESKAFAKKYGFTTTLWGRKRRLPDLALPEYEFDYSESFLQESAKKDIERDVIKSLKECYWDTNKKEEIKENLYKKYKVRVKENNGFIAQAERQVLNARIQGSAADMTKKALIAVGTNKELKDLGFQLIVPVHDEILAQCPLANVKRCKEIFTYEMSNAAKDKVDIKITVDPAISFAWYGEPIVVD